MRVAATALAVVVGACSGDGGGNGGDPASTSRDTSVEAPATPGTTDAPVEMSADGVVALGDVPDEETIFAWVREVFDQGIRRPGYPADQWAEQWAAERFREIGLDDVRLEPITVTRWEPTAWSLEVVDADGATTAIESFPVPFSAPVDGLEVELAAYDETTPASVAGKASLFDAPLITIPADLLATSGSAPEDPTGRIIDADGTLAGAPHTVPFSGKFQAVMEPSIEAGAAAFVGTLTGYPGDSHEYFVPYDAEPRSIPGVWVSGSEGARLRTMLAEGPLRLRLTVEAEQEEVESFNVVGELPGADDETVMIGSHHDGPWGSAVEDASGMALVLAQATYWSAQPAERRPHRLVFVLQGGHMSGGAGLRGYIEAHSAELDDMVLEVHLEHAALEFAEIDGELRPTGLPVPRWFFTSRIPRLERAVSDALTTEALNRSLILAPDAFGDQPPTDGAFFHTAGVPVVNFLAAPFYLFDSIDTLDKVDRASLEPLTRAAVRIIDSTAGVSASEMRAGVVEEPEPAG
ncbi:MAG: M28 family peptidase [Acidimicrobiia bacterium]|nr:M28 family peptidase [Acidimicrobiia bacterium]